MLYFLGLQVFSPKRSCKRGSGAREVVLNMALEFFDRCTGESQTDTRRMVVIGPIPIILLDEISVWISLL